MLSRVADSLLWMSRYIERADNIARWVEVNQQLFLDMGALKASRLKKDWSSLIACLNLQEPFKKTNCQPDSHSVIEFLVFDSSHSDSILSALRIARENTRAVREQISEEMWEQVNQFYLWMIDKAARQEFQKNPYEFFQRIIRESRLFQGVTNTSMIHNEGWLFIQVGKYIERADKLSRFLDDKFHLMSAGEELLQWVAVLRACSARQAYQKIYHSEVTPKKVAELLLLGKTFPRSVEFCVRNADIALRKISGVSDGEFSNTAEKISGRLLAELTFSSIDDYWVDGLHLTADRIQLRLNQLTQAIYDTYINNRDPVLNAALTGKFSSSQ